MKAIQKITAVFLALVFLFSSFGFTISSMVCVKSGQGKVSLSSIEDCCVKTKTIRVAATACCDDDNELALPLPQSNSLVKKGDCCDINNFTIKLTDFQKSEKSTSEQPVILHTFFNFEQAFSVSKTEHALAYSYSDLPPPLHGRTLLNFISTLLI